MLLHQIKGCVWLYRCDWCGLEFEAAFSKSKSQTQGCNRSCGSKAARATVKANLLEKHGVENVSQLREVREKVKQTCLERYGAEHSWQAESVKARIKQTMVERHGADSPWRVPEIRAKIESDNLEKYGVKHVWANSEIREKSKQTMLEMYGVDNPQKSEAIRARTQETCMERYGVSQVFASLVIRETMRRNHHEKYGVDNPSQRDEIKLKKKKTSLKRYGVPYPMQSAEVQKKLLASFLMKGKGFVSKVELRCLAALREIFDTVEHQEHINGWLIDFYVPNVQTYVQFDGVYWHGLDLTLEQLQHPQTKREHDISRKWHRDRAQDDWFKVNNRRLVRIREDDFKRWEIEGIVVQNLKELLT